MVYWLHYPKGTKTDDSNSYIQPKSTTHTPGSEQLELVISAQLDFMLREHSRSHDAMCKVENTRKIPVKNQENSFSFLGYIYPFLYRFVYSVRQPCTALLALPFLYRNRAEEEILDTHRQPLTAEQIFLESVISII